MKHYSLCVKLVQYWCKSLPLDVRMRLSLAMFFLASFSAFAQPANNNWANAIEIAIPNDDFGIGAIQSAYINMTGASSQPGEYLQNPTYPKTVWFKFSIPAHRLVRVKIMQPAGGMVPGSDAGFSVYHSTPAIPTAADLAVFTPMLILDSYTENVCLEQGEYYIQMVSKNSVLSELFVELNVSYTYPVSTSHAHDQVESAANIGTLVANNYNNFNWDCLSIQSPQEYNASFGADSINFTKSIWYRFTTDNHIDLFSYYVGYPVWALNNAPVSVRIFEGAVDLATLDTTTAIYSAVRPMNSTYTHLYCDLKPNTEYYVQLLGRVNYLGNSTFYLRHLGEAETTGAYPQEAAFNPLNDFGTVVPTPSPGTTVVRQDYFSCDALLTNDSIQCGVVNPPDMVTIGATNYDLTTWFTIDVPNPANVLLRAYVQNQYCNSQYYNHYMHVRIFNQTPDNDCANFTLPGSLYYEGPFDVNGAIVMNCLPAGNYSIQLLGRSNLAADPYNCNNSQFGRRVNFAITLMGVPTTEYALLTAGDVDWINAGSPLLDNILYTADSSSFSCEKTVIPDTAICSNIVDRAMYRQFIIGDADNDAVPDSGMVTIENYNYYNEIQNHLVKSVFYRGDAEQLAAAQNVYSWPSQIDGLDPYQGCNMYNNFFRPNWPYNIPHNPKKFCVTPGTYTLVNVGDSTENGAIMAPRFRFTKTITNHWNPASPYGMGDIIAQGLNVLSPVDTFSCRNNADTIAGLAPCAGYTKLVYREFYISQDCRITVTENSGTTQPYSQMRVFSGRVSTDGIAGLTLAPYHTNGCYTSSYTLPPCATVPAGWYTAVSYGYGPTYDNNYTFHEATTYNNYTNLYNIDHTTAIRVVADTTVPPGPFFNRPYKACVANNDLPLTWVNTGTPSVPSAATSYTLCMERFKPLQDTPYASLPILGCAGTVRLAYYVFTTDEEYYVRISGIDGYSKELYPLDVRVDSLLFPTTTPIAGCTNTGNMIEVCRLQPGIYTLVVYGTPAQDCITFTPVIAVQPVEVSRFDFAQNAYDFGLVPGDNVYHPGKVGDVHPTDPTLLPSNDFFYCTTGAFASDPSGACTNTLYPPIYPDQPNNAYFQEPGAQTWYKRRNLWYTFVLQGMGQSSFTIRNLTNPGSPIPFRMYYSDVDGEIPFEDLYALGELDSTAVSGLTAVHTNITGGWCSRYQESTYTFINDICEIDTLKRRYYIVAELDEYYTSYPNVQMDLQIRWAPINANPQDPKYDHYSEANAIGNNEDAPPYTDVALQYDTPYVGGWGNMSCATGDAADAIWSCTPAQGDQRSLWWKLRVDQPGFIRMAVESDATAPSSFNRVLMKQTINGDSVISTNGSTGLVSLGNGSGIGVPGSPLQWYRYCVDPGVYYYHVQRCANVDTSNVRAHAYFTTITGDNCFNAVSGTAATYGVNPLSIPIVCHTMGGDFGEDGSNMGCLQGPQDYKSTWFKFSYTGTDIADILFQLNLSGLSNYISAANVRYRLFYGSDCTTMIAGAECSTNAYINNSIACVTEANGDFYVQVVYPIGATGTLGFTFTVSATTNPDCNPFDPTLIVSDFFYQPNCAGDSLIFYNYATSGSSVEYLWDFGDGTTSIEDNPVHAYTPGDYDVTLYVINPILMDTASMTQTVTLSASGSPLELGDDVTICLGESASIGQALTLATYEWSTGEQTDFINVTDAGWYYLDIEWGGCPYSDSIQIHVLDLAFDLGADPFFCAGASVVLSPSVYPGVDFLWSDGSSADTLLIDQAGQYYLDISIGNCTQTDTVVVDVLDLSFTLGNDTTICAGSTYLLTPTVTAGVIYDWSDNSAGTSLSISDEGTYSLTVSDQGCSATDEIEIDVLNLTFSLGPDTLFCVNESITLAPSVAAGSGFTWSDGSTNSTLIVDTEGQYFLDIENIGCTASDTVYVSELDLTFTLGNDTTICEGASLLLSPVVWPGAEFEWSTNQTSSSISVSTDGEYALTISMNGCTAIDEIDVDVLDLAFTLGNDTIICNGNSITLQPDVMAGVNHTWSDSSTGNSFTTSEAGIVTLTIDSIGCTAQDEVEIDIFYVNAIVPTAYTICLNDTADLVATGAEVVEWTNGTSFITTYSPLHFGLHPAINTTFNWVAHEAGCTETGTTQVEVHQPFIPTVVYDDFYCTNEPEVELPLIAGTTGNFYYNNNPIVSLPISSLQAGNHLLNYQYTDDVNNCPWQIDLPFEIADTTTLLLSAAPLPLCIDAAPVDYSSLINVNGGQWYALYNGIDWTEAMPFMPDGWTAWDDATPALVPLQYQYTNDAGCNSALSTSVTIHPIPVVEIFITEACAEGDVEIENTSFVQGSAVSATWNFQQHGASNEWEPQSIGYTDAGDYSYSLIVTSAIGCELIQEGFITIHPLPVADFEWQGGCEQEEVLFTSTSNISNGEITEYQWSLPNGPFGSSSTAAYTFPFSGNYNLTLQVLSAQGCSDDTTQSISILAIPTGSIIAENVCHGESVTLSATYASSGGNIVEHTWNIPGEIDNENTPVVTNTFAAPGVFYVAHSIESENGCVNVLMDSIVVYPLPVPSYLPSLFELCLYQTDTLTGTSQVDWPYSIATQHWSFSNGFEAQGSSIVFEATPVGFVDLELTAVSDVGCVATLSMNEAYLVRPLPIADFILTPEVLSYEQPDLEVEDASQGSTTWAYTISDGHTTDVASFVHRIEENGLYEIEQIVSNQFGCVDTISKSIEFIPGLIVHIPNAFTPDNDGLNDVFRPVIFGDDIAEYNLIIWDRWGMEIFNSTNPNEVWTGNVLGGNHYAKSEVYNYRLQLRGILVEEQVFSGSVALLR